MHYHIIYKVIHDHTCIPAKYWLSEPYKRASYNTSRPEKIFAISLWSRVRLEGTPKSQWFFSGSIPFFTSFQDKPRNITLSGIYIYIQLYHHDVPLHHQFLHHLNTISHWIHMKSPWNPMENPSWHGPRSIWVIAVKMNIIRSAWGGWFFEHH